MIESSRNRAHRRLLIFAALFCTGNHAFAQAPLKAQKAILAMPQKPAVMPAAAPARKSDKLLPDRATVNLNLSGPLQYLDQINMPGWTGKPILIKKFSPGEKLAGSSAISASTTSETSAPEAAQENFDSALEFGLNTLARKTFVQGPRTIYVSIFEFPRAEGAFGAYYSMKTGSSNFIAKGDASSEDDHGISFCQNRFFVSVQSSTNNDDYSMAAVATLAKQLGASIALHGSKPEILSHLPLAERVQGSEKFVMGPIALKRYFPAPFVSTLASGAPFEGAIADYQTQEPHRERLKVLVARFANPLTASLSFTKYVSQLEENHDLENADGYAYQSSVFKAGNRFILCQMRGNQVVIITGAHKKNSLAYFARGVY
jgi:hypothetical protein